MEKRTIIQLRDAQSLYEASGSIYEIYMKPMAMKVDNRGQDRVYFRGCLSGIYQQCSFV